MTEKEESPGVLGRVARLVLWVLVLLTSPFFVLGFVLAVPARAFVAGMDLGTDVVQGATRWLRRAGRGSR